MKSHNNLLEDSLSFNYLQTPPGISRAAAAALIGPEGGVVRVTDPRSPISGTTLKIPKGALDAHELIQIKEGENECTFGLGPSVKILPEGLQFNHPAKLDMPIHFPAEVSEDLEPALFVYDRKHEDWYQKDDSVIEPEDGMATCRIWHL